jgi:hypothetical protein
MGRQSQTWTTDMGMWLRTLLAATSMCARTYTSRSRYVGADATVDRILASTDMFFEMTVSQKLVFGYKVRFVSRA